MCFSVNHVLDLETFHHKLLSALPTLPVDFESHLDRLLDCCADVFNARACVPRLSFLNMRVMLPDLTFAQSQLDLDNLEKAEAAFEAEAAREYNFEESPALGWLRRRPWALNCGVSKAAAE